MDSARLQDSGTQPGTQPQTDAQTEAIERLKPQSEELAASDSPRLVMVESQQSDQRRGRRKPESSQKCGERPVTMKNRSPLKGEGAGNEPGHKRCRP